MRVRLLPVTITAAALVLSLRAFDLWSYGAPALAQTAPAAPATPAQPAAAQSPAPAAAPAQAGAGAPKPSRQDPNGIPEYTEAELSVLQELASRRETLDQRGAQLDQREALLKAAEQRIEAKVQELKQLQSTMESMVRRYNEEEDARKKSLVKIFETMKPAEAARIFEQMDLPVLIDVIARMKERNAAPILAQMHPVRAKQVTAELARQRQPEPAAPAAPNG